MWRRNACLVATFLLVHEATNTSLGQQQPAASLVSKSRWACFELTLGRITATSIVGGQRECRNGEAAQDAFEALTINTDAEIPSIRYESVDELRTLHIDVVDGSQIKIHRQGRGSSAGDSVMFTQSKSGAIKLTVEDAVSSRDFRAASLWHLLLAEPEVCRQHLLPLLEPLNADWRLEESAEQVEAALCRVGPTEAIPRARIRGLVAQLGAPAFPARQAADRELRSLGVGVLPYLATLEGPRLAREQRWRLARIRQDLPGLASDTPDRVAAWLVNDESLWRAWTGHPAAARRLASAQGLAGIGRPLEAGAKPLPRLAGRPARH